MNTKLVVSLVAALALALAILVPAGAGAVGVGKSCGGFFGPQCDAGMFCQFKAGTCGRVDLRGTCARTPKICSQITGPKLVVCGCNGQTYPNDCMRQAAGTSLAHKGKCE
jgi:hypothetical protein